MSMRWRGDTRLGLTNQSHRTRVADNLAYLKRAVFGEARNGKVMRKCERLLKSLYVGPFGKLLGRAFKRMSQVIDCHLLQQIDYARCSHT